MLGYCWTDSKLDTMSFCCPPQDPPLSTHTTLLSESSLSADLNEKDFELFFMLEDFEVSINNQNQSAITLNLTGWGCGVVGM